MRLEQIAISENCGRWPYTPPSYLMSKAPRKNPGDPLAIAASQIRPAAPQAKPQAPTTASSGSGFWMPPIFLGAVLLGAYILLKKPDGLWPFVVGAIFVVVFAWFFISTLWPRFAERTCPTCGEDGLTPLDENSHRGLRCNLCGFEDESLSSFFIAEEDGVLEETVMRERGRAPKVPKVSGEKL